MAQRASSRKPTDGSRKRSTAPDTRDLSRFVSLAREGLDALAQRKSALGAHFQPIDELHARYAPQFDPDERSWSTPKHTGSAISICHAASAQP